MTTVFLSLFQSFTSCRCYKAAPTLLLILTFLLVLHLAVLKGWIYYNYISEDLSLNLSKIIKSFRVNDHCDHQLAQISLAREFIL
jgi:hypothetical protein